MKRHAILKFAAKFYSGFMVAITFINYPIIWHFRKQATTSAYKSLLRLSN